MGFFCFGECEEAKARVEESARRISDLRDQVADAQAESRRIEKQMQATYDKMAEEKNAHIGTLKQQIEDQKEAKRVNDCKMDRLSNQMFQMSMQHGKDMVEAQKAFAQTVEKKDQMTKEMMTEMFSSFMVMMKEQSKTNQENFKMMMAQAKIQDDRIHDILVRMDKRMALIEKKQFGITEGVDYASPIKVTTYKVGCPEDGSDAPALTANSTGSEDFATITAPMTGAELYRMVEERKQELAFAGKFVPKWQFKSTGPIIAAAYAAIEAMASYSGLPQISQ